MEKVILVTGAGSGIGKFTALELLKNGYRLVLAGRRAAALTEVLIESGVPSDQGLIVPTDVTDPDAVRELFAKIRDTFGGLDVLFNNAGIGAPAVPLESLELSQWKAVIDTNLTGSFLCAREAIKIMKDQAPQGGRIINNGSLSAHVPRPYSAPYTASKHAISGLTKSISLDYRKYNISCCQIDIGNAATPMTERMSKGVLQPNGQSSTEPTMKVEDVARAIRFLVELPLDTNVPFMTIMANEMPYIGRG